MITVGLDFGTHQTKICIERKEGVELEYSFVKFNDSKGGLKYTLPTVIGVGEDNRLTYGFLPHNYKGRIIRYFKQSAFCMSSSLNALSQQESLFYSILYVANLLFDLEEQYGQMFTIQMGAPADGSSIVMAKKIATTIVASAYRLVEDVFENDKKSFLNATLQTLKELTEIVEYSDSIKEEYGLLVFPEAYACLKPLTSQGKISYGMSLMIDVGGGTTDISFFTVLNGKPQVYDYFSINKGLNYLTCAEDKVKDNRSLDSNVKNVIEINATRLIEFTKEVGCIANHLHQKLINEFRSQTNLKIERLNAALKNRPLIYSGGGSTFPNVIRVYDGFKELKVISFNEWNQKAVKDISEIKSRNLCPILSTAYGLAISTENDNIKLTPFRDISKSMRGASEEVKKPQRQRPMGNFSYMDDYDAWK